MHKNFHPAKRFSMLILFYPLLVSNPKVEQNLALVLDEYFTYMLYSYITFSVIISHYTLSIKSSPPFVLTQ